MRKSLMGFVVGCVWVAQVHAATLYVDVDSANPISPYNSWATAATGIQDAVDAAVSNDTIRCGWLMAPTIRAVLSPPAMR